MPPISAESFDRSSRRDDADAWSSVAGDGMVSTAHYCATAAGRDILALGGSAADAAVAAAFALAVCEPAESGLGGMAMATVFEAASGATLVVEGQCRAPGSADPAVVKHLDRARGYGVVAVPTAVAVAAHLLECYGSLPLAAVLEPAIRLAEEGYRQTHHQHGLTARFTEVLTAGNTGATFLTPGGFAPAVGTTLRQPILAQTLRRLADHGLRDFYEGEIAAAIDADMRSGGGFVRLEDLASCRPGILEPLAIPWASSALGPCTLLTSGPPAGGMALAQMIRLDAALPDPLSPLRTPTGDCPLRLAAIIRRVRADRRRTATAVGATDPGAAGELLSETYARNTAAELRAGFDGDGNTTHLSVMDAAGNAVALTLSINRCFGAAVATEELGFLYNGYLRAFKVESTEHPHFLRPGAIARSNSVPTLVMRNGRILAAVGSTGSERIPSGVFQVLSALGRGVTPFEAVHAPRLHATPENLVRLEADRFDPAVGPTLEAAGFHVEDAGPFAFYMGGAHLVTRGENGFLGVADPRRDGAALGPPRDQEH